MTMQAEADPPEPKRGRGKVHVIQGGARLKQEWQPIPGVRRTASGCLEHMTDVEAGKYAFLSSPIAIVAMSRNGDGHGWGRVIDVLDADGRMHRWCMPMSALAGQRGADFVATLLSLGATIAPGSRAAAAMHRFLSADVDFDGKPLPRARSVAKVGWHGDAYVLPDRAIGSDETIVWQSTSEIRPALRSAGTLEDWQASIAMPSDGNSRLVFAISAAFAAPLLRPLEAEGFGVHFVGGSSLGKTSALQVAGSVWGGGSGGYIQSWQATANGVEAMAEAHNDGLLCLDEMGLVKAEDAARTAYGLAQGLGRQRALKSGMGASRLEWRVLVLSTGEVGLDDKLREARQPQRLMAGQEVRFLGLPADACQGFGIFDAIEVHDGETKEAAGKRLSDSLKLASAKHYGTAGPAFVEKFVGARARSIDMVRTIMRDFVQEVAHDAGGQAQRVATRFGIVAAAGELAAVFNIVPWRTGEATNAAKTMFVAWLNARGGKQDSEAEDVVTHLRAVIERDGASRFQRVGIDHAPLVHERLGFIKAGNDLTYLVLPEAFKSIMQGRDWKRAADVLIARGIVIPERGHRTQSVRVSTEIGKTRVYVISHAALFSDGAPEAGDREVPHE